eukprot:gene9808-2133_t
MFTRKFVKTTLKPNVKYYTEGPKLSHYLNKYTFTEKLGLEIVNDPLLNKGLAFTMSERDRLRIRGLLPPQLMNIKTQLKRLRLSLEQLSTDIDRYMFCVNVLDRNETLFYQFVSQNLAELAPIIYTPTVGEACMKFSSLYRRPRGMYFSIGRDRGEMATMIYNWPSPDVDIIVITDGGRILGLGDLGANGMAIPIGKLSLYVAAGGINPGRTLPIFMDVGTDNKEFRENELYIGENRPRARGDEYFSFLDEMMEAIRQRYPDALIQFEDFTTQYAYDILQKYKSKHLCFNDDIQGTGAVTLAALLNALRAQGKTFTDLRDQKIVMVGGGTAGLGVAFNIRKEGASIKDANDNFYVVDVDGLVSKSRQNLKFGLEEFARSDLEEGMKLLDVVKAVKPNIILGLSGTPGLFTEEVIKEMYKHEKKPIIFPLSNPTSRSECSAEEAYKWTDGNCIFASGSPFDPVILNGKKLIPTQCNNMYIFPGVGLGGVVGRCKKISNDMFYAATKKLASYQSKEKVEQGYLFPKVSDIKEVSALIAASVIESAKKEGLVQNSNVPRDLKDIEAYVLEKQWKPEYHHIVLSDL